MAFTAAQLLAAVKRRCFWPTLGAPLANADILAIADEELIGKFYALVQGAGGDYYLTFEDLPLVNGTSKYRLPADAYGAVKDVALVDSSGVEYSLPWIDAEHISHGDGSGDRYYGQIASGPASGSRSYAIYFEADKICTQPAVTEAAGCSLRVRYYAKPGQLSDGVDPLPAALVVSALSLATVPLAFETLVTAVYATDDVVDIVGAGNASAFVRRGAVITDTTDLGGNTIFEIDETLIDSGIAIGDYVIETGYTPVVQLPNHLHTAFMRWVSGCCLQATADARASGELQLSQNVINDALRTPSKPRLQGEPKYTVARNSPFRMGRR